MNDEDIRRMLREDVGDDELLETVKRLRAWRAPEPDKAQTAALIEVLESEMPAGAKVPFKQQLAEWWPLLILRSQVRIVRGDIFLASLLVMMMGVFITLPDLTGSAQPEDVPLALLAPIVTAVGVAFLYGPDSDPALEITLAAPVSPRLLLLARLLLLFAFDLAIGIGGSVILALFGLSLLPLLSAWLAPMAFLSGLAFLLSVLVREPLFGALASVGLWAVLVLNRLSGTLPIPDLTGPMPRFLMWAAALIMAAAALWLGGEEERWFGGYHVG